MYEFCSYQSAFFAIFVSLYCVNKFSLFFCVIKSSPRYRLLIRQRILELIRGNFTMAHNTGQIYPLICFHRTIYRVEMISRDCSILVEKINHSSGKSEWKIMPSDYDYSRVSTHYSNFDLPTLYLLNLG